jgi:hypothetical protein
MVTGIKQGSADEIASALESSRADWKKRTGK